MSRLYLFALVLFATTAVAWSQQSEIITLPDTSRQYHDGDDPRCGTVSGEGCTLQAAHSVAFRSTPEAWEPVQAASCENAYLYSGRLHGAYLFAWRN